MPRRSAVSGPIDDVHLVAFLEQIRHPTGRPSGVPIQSTPWPPPPCTSTIGNGRLTRAGIQYSTYICLPFGARAAGEARLLDSDPEVAPLSKVDWRGSRTFGVRGAGQRHPARRRHAGSTSAAAGTRSRAG